MTEDKGQGSGAQQGPGQPADERAGDEQRDQPVQRGLEATGPEPTDEAPAELTDGATDTPTSDGGGPADAPTPDSPTSDDSTGETGETPAVDEPSTDEFEPLPAIPPVSAYAYGDLPAGDVAATDKIDAGAHRADTTQFSTAEFGTGEYGTGAADDGLTDETAAQPETAAPVRRNTGKIIAFSSLAVILVVVIGLIGSELYFRKSATDCLSEQFGSLTGAQTNVELSNRPVLLQHFSGEVPYVQVDTSDEAADQMQLHLRAEGIRDSDGVTKIDSLQGTGFIPFARVATLSREAGGANADSGGMIGDGAIESVTGNQNEGTLEVESTIRVAVFPVTVTTIMTPILADGNLTFEVDSVNAMSFIPVPPEFAQQVVDEVTEALFGELFGEVDISTFTVQDNGVDVVLRGSDVSLDALEGSGSGSVVSCG